MHRPSSTPLATLALVAPLLLPACLDLSNPDSDSDAATTTAGTTTPDPTTEAPPTTTSGLDLVCIPGTERCINNVTREVCKPTGLAWAAETCGNYENCLEEGSEPDTKAVCSGPCDVASDTPNSVGCEFLAIRVRSGNGEVDLDEFFDAVIVGNPDSRIAEVQLYFTPELSRLEAPVGDPIILSPNEAHVFQLTNKTVPGFSTLRAGGVYRVRSDVPVIAYLHSPLKNTNSNDASMLLPVKTLRKDYVVASYPPLRNKNNPDAYAGRPSFFNIIALEEKTTVRWTPRYDTAGNGIKPEKIAAFETGEVTINRLDLMQIGASSITNTDFKTHDVSGTVIRSDKPIWVLGGTACAVVPFDAADYCNHLQEQMLPIDYWGTRYVGAHSPVRNNEPHLWRIYAGESAVTVTTDPAQPGTPFTLNQPGEFRELIVQNGRSFTFQGTGAFLPVQYLYSNLASGGKGDPSMYQMVPIEQYLRRYVFMPGLGYAENYAQIIRVKDADDVRVNGEVVTGYYLVNAVNGLRYEIADVLLPSTDEPTVMVAESDDPFGLLLIGYTGIGQGNGSAYAYPGGMALRPIGGV